MDWPCHFIPIAWTWMDAADAVGVIVNGHSFWTASKLSIKTDSFSSSRVPLWIPASSTVIEVMSTSDCLPSYQPRSDPFRDFDHFPDKAHLSNSFRKFFSVFLSFSRKAPPICWSFAQHFFLHFSSLYVTEKTKLERPASCGCVWYNKRPHRQILWACWQSIKKLFCIHNNRDTCAVSPKGQSFMISRGMAAAGGRSRKNHKPDGNRLTSGQGRHFCLRLCSSGHWLTGNKAFTGKADIWYQMKSAW